jgi:hypothetical protein
MTLAAIICDHSPCRLVEVGHRQTFLHGFARDYIRGWPELRKVWLGNGSRVAFSRRFGLAYAIACIAGAFIWMLAALRFIPDTEAGAWLLFGPSMALIIVGVVLGMLSTWLAGSATRRWQAGFQHLPWARSRTWRRRR